MHGTRIQVWRGTAKKTRGGLTKAQLKKNKYGKLVSKKASAAAKKKSNLPGVSKKKKSNVK